jgi:uncharacterized membrane protein
MASLIYIILLTVTAALFAAFTQYFYKKHLGGFGFDVKSLIATFTNKGILFGILLNFVSLGIYLVALRSGQLSFIYPVFASTFVFTILISKYMFKERVSAARAFGLVLIVAGIVLIAATF